MAIELLQQVGLNKYESEAYYTLIVEGPLTGYELGKRSNVPLSRSYGILNRLMQKGLAVIQPGGPPRYAAEGPEHWLDRVRQAHAATLTALTAALAELRRPSAADEFWVRRSRQNILAKAQAMVAQAERTVDLRFPATVAGELMPALDRARLRGCRVLALSAVAAADADADWCCPPTKATRSRMPARPLVMLRARTPATAKPTPWSATSRYSRSASTQSCTRAVRTRACRAILVGAS